MKRGNLVIYDLEGTIISQSGEADGEWVPHIYPVGVPYLELPFGVMKGKNLLKIDTSDSRNHVPVFEDIPYVPTYEDLQNELLIAKGVI